MTPFLMPTFLRQTPKHLLGAYFDRRNLLTDVPVGQLRAHDHQLIQDAIVHLPVEEHVQVDRDFQDIHLLANKSGYALLVDEVGNTRPDIIAQIERMDDPYTLAMWLFLNCNAHDHDVFARCLGNQRIREMSFTRAKRRKHLPQHVPASDPETCRKMAAGISALYLKQGRGRRCEVVPYHQPTRDEYLYAGFPEDFGESALQYGSVGLECATRKPAFQVGLIFRADEGTLDVSAPGGRKEVDALLGIFLATALDYDGPLPAGSDQCFRLGSLLDRAFALPTDPADGIERVEIASMRLSRNGTHQRVTVEDDPAGVEDFYDRLERTLRHPVAAHTVVDAKLRFVWLSVDGRAPKTLTFTIGHPDSTDLRHEPEHRLAKRYLHRWGLST